MDISFRYLWIGSLVFLGVAGFTVAGMNMGADPPNVSDKEVCESNGGEFLEESSECVDVGKKLCDSLNGEYDSCASACRNNDDAVVCTQQCVQVCDLQ